MIYSYKYKKHKIEGFHKAIMFFFDYLIKNNPTVFDRAKMFPKDFEEAMKASKRKFDPLLIDIIDKFNFLSLTQKDKVKSAFDTNNKIQALCEGKLNPVRYSDLELNFAKVLKKFSEMLWEDYSHNLKIQIKCGTVKDHFDAFVASTHQEAKLCPFCGLTGLKPEGSNHRDAYDHYLAKSIYPFISMNFYNLVPACHECNSLEKGDHPVLFHKKSKKSQLVFYPFDIKHKTEKLDLKIVPKARKGKSSNSHLLRKTQWTCDITYDGKSDQKIDSWNDIYGIHARNEKLLKSYESNWFDWILDRYKEATHYGIPFLEFKTHRLEETKKQIITQPMGWLKHEYVKYLFAQTNIEDRLKLTIKQS